MAKQISFRLERVIEDIFGFAEVEEGGSRISRLGVKMKELGPGVGWVPPPGSANVKHLVCT